MFRAILICTLIIVQLMPGFPQPEILEDPYLKFDHLTSRDGLSHNFVLDIFQDKEGFIWIATVEGLNKFDGYKFTTFLSRAEDSSSLSSSHIGCLAGDSNGNLWVGTSQGLNLYDPERNSFRNSRNSNDSLFDDRHIRAILPDGEFLWVETATGDLLKVRLSSFSSNSYPHAAPGMVNTYFYHSLMKDRAGKIWTGGRYMGMYVFDPISETFNLVKNDPDDPDKKRDNDVATYFQDSHGNFWIGGIDGLYLYDQRKDLFRKILPVSTFSIAEDHDGNLWIGTGSGLYLYEMKENKMHHFLHSDDNRFSLIHNHINKILIDRAGNVWLGTLDGISIHRPAKNKFRHYFHIPGNTSTPVSSHITSAMEDNEGNIWLGTAEKGVEVFDPNMNKIITYSHTATEPYNLASDRISVISQDASGDVWIGQWSGRGFNIVNPKSRRNTRFRILEKGLMADWYNAIFHDDAGNHWLGVWGAQGLYRFNKQRNTLEGERFEPFVEQATHIKKLASDGKRVWLATDHQSRFLCYDINSGRLQSYRKDNYLAFEFSKILDIINEGDRIVFLTNAGKYKLVTDPAISFDPLPGKVLEEALKPKMKDDISWLTDSISIYAMKKDHEGILWAGTDKGLFKNEHGRITRFNLQNAGEGWLSDTINDLEIINAETTLLASEQGLVKHDVPTGSFIPVRADDRSYLSSHLIKFIYEDSMGNLWVGTTNNGLNKLDPATGEIMQFPDKQEDSLGFWGQQASCAVEGNDGILWFGGFGLNRFDPVSGTFSHLTTVNGLAHNDIRSIELDDAGNLWIGTANGLSSYDLPDGQFTNYYEKDGLQDNEFSSASCRLGDGLLAFGGKNGLNVFNPSDIHRNRQVPAIMITGFRIFEEPSAMPTNGHSKIDLKYDQNYFSFEFTALDYSDPSGNKFAYKLENFDEEWITTGSDNRVARYTNVDPGKYTFRVIGANSDGTWNKTGVSFPLIIHPPFWRTGWFYTILALLGLSVLFLYIKYREKKINAHNRVLLLEQKLLRSQMNPHFIFNSLSSIQSFIFENNPITAGSYLSRFAELIRSILYNSREEHISLAKEIQTLQNYLELQQLRYNSKFEYSIEIDPEIDMEELSIPPMLAQPFIENAIEHGIKHLEGKGSIRLHFGLEHQRLLLTVEDNGIGLDAARKLKNSKAGEHRSLATIITKERIDILNRSQPKKKYSMEINEIQDNGVVKGTKVVFSLPVICMEQTLFDGNN